MPIGKKQGNPLLYTLIIFVGISIAAVAMAIVFFVQTEGYKSKAATLESQTEELATNAEVHKLGALVGEKQRQKSRVGTLLGYVDEATSLITGRVSEDSSAEMKISSAKQKVKEVTSQLAKTYPDISAGDANSAGLVPLIEKLSAKLNDSAKAVAAEEEQLKDLKKRFDDTIQNNLDKEKTLSEEKDKALQQVITIQQNYADLKALMEKSSSQQVKSLSEQLETEKAATKKMNQDILKSDAELKMAQDKIKRIQQSLQAALPPPDANTAAYKIDGRIVLLDEKTKTVFISIGSDDHVYPGMTFAVYEQNMPLPKDGKGKAEIEVYSVGKNVSTARITQWDPKKPIIVNDVVANLVWDSSRTNVFVVAGDFDLSSSGTADKEGDEKIKALIEKWGGKVEDAISVDTDFLVLGVAPQKPKKPTLEETEANPAAMEKYESELKRISQYEEAQKQAEKLSVPILNTERFLYFIGYKSQAARPGAF